MKTINLDSSALIDGLGRAKFASHLLDLVGAVDSTRGAVIGLEGTWGSGKSSVLTQFHLFAEALDDAIRPTILSFNPWMVSGTRDMVEAMLTQLAKDLKVESLKHPSANGGLEAAQKIFDYVEVLKAVKYVAPFADLVAPGVGITISGIAYAAEAASKETGWLKKKLFERNTADKEKAKKSQAAPSLLDSKNAVSAALRKRATPVVLILDDIDRLPPNDVAAVIQAVKAVADFPNVIYILAYDPVITAKAIKIAVEVEDGLSYLEKIIQLPVRLPEIPVSRLNAFTRATLEPILPSSGPTVADLGSVWDVVCPLMRTPRDVERLRTRLQVAVPVLQDHVDLADVMLLEALDLTQPSVIKWIVDSAGLLMDAHMSGYDDDLSGSGMLTYFLSREGDEARRQAEAEAKKSWEPLVPHRRERAVVKRALDFLFARGQSNDRSVSRSNKYRVKDFNFWYKWRCYHDQHEEWSSPQLLEFMAKPASILSAGIHQDRNLFLDLVFVICDRRGRLNFEPDSQGVLDVFEKSEESIDLVSMRSWGHIYKPLQVLELAVSLDSKHGLGTTLLAATRLSVHLAADFVHMLYRAAEHDSSALGALKPAIDLWVDRAKKEILTGMQVKVPRDISKYFLALTIKQLGRSDVARDIVEEYLAGDVRRLQLFYDDYDDATVTSGQTHGGPFDSIARPQVILAVANSNPNFLKSHSMLVTALRQAASQNGTGQNVAISAVSSTSE